MLAVVLLRERLTWGYDNPNKTAVLIASLLVAVWALPAVVAVCIGVIKKILPARWRETHKTAFWRASFVIRELVWWSALAACLWFTWKELQTGSRGGAVGAIAGIAALLTTKKIRLLKRSLISRVHFAGGVLAVVFVIIAAVWLVHPAERLAPSYSIGDASAGARLKIWKHVPAMFADAPDGWGIGKAPTAFLDWYQDELHRPVYSALINSHFEWLVEFNFWGRIAYLLAWALAFRLAFRSPATFGTLVAFFVSASFSTVFMEWQLWIVPVLLLCGVLIRRIYEKRWPKLRNLLLTVLLPAAAVFTVLTIWGTVTSDYSVRERGAWVKIGRGAPAVVFLVNENAAEGSRDFRYQVDKLKQKQKLDVLLWTTLVERAGAEINDNFDTLVVLGKPTEKRMEIIRKLAKQARRVIISGGFIAPFALGKDAAGKNILDKTQAFGGEFCSGEFLEAWRETGKFDESAGRGDFVEGWLKKVFPDAAGSAADGVNGGTGTTGGKKSFGVFYSLFPTAQANEKAQTNAKTVIFKTLKLPTPRGMTRAELVYLSPAVPPAQCAGTLLLCPGWNGDGTFFLHDSAWRSLAEKHNLSLVALRFSSYDEGESVSPAAEKNGYHHAANGAGALLFEGLRKINGSDLPLAVFGFSRGGQFAQSLAVNFPERVLAWASTGSATGDEFPNAKSGKVLNSPPGLVMCGFDDTNCSTAQSVFLAGLRAGWKMCWLGIKNSGHQIDPRGTVFAQKFFDGVLISVLKNSPPENNRSGIWVDAAERNGLDGFLIKVWFPNKVVQKAWEDFGAR